MKKRCLIIFSLLFVFITSCSSKTTNHEPAVRQALQTLENCWNKKDLKCMMNGYVRSENITYVGGSQFFIRGWNGIYQHFKTAYDTPEKMGNLKLEPIDYRPIDENTSLMIAKITLITSGKTRLGYTSLIFRRINGQWLVIADHSS